MKLFSILMADHSPLRETGLKSKGSTLLGSMQHLFLFTVQTGFIPYCSDVNRDNSPKLVYLEEWKDK